MMGFNIVNMRDMAEEMGEDYVKKVVSRFVCPYNHDVEYFLHERAYQYAVQRVSSTHLVYASYKDEQVLVGYYTLAQKHFHVDLKHRGKLSSKLRHRLNKFGKFDAELKKTVIAAPLIGQLGKNYADGYDKLIKGSELLKMACDAVAAAQRLIGGKVVYLECEDIPALKDFYKRAGFVEFGERPLEGDEKDAYSGKYLIQMLKYLD